MRQEQSLVKVGRVEHEDDPVGFFHALHAAEDHVDRDVFLQRVCAQGMGARKIDKLDCLVIDLEETDVPLNGHARVIADALLETGQTIE